MDEKGPENQPEKGLRTKQGFNDMFSNIPYLHSPEEVASGPRILCWVMFFPYLGLASLSGLVLYI